MKRLAQTTAGIALALALAAGPAAAGALEDRVAKMNAAWDAAFNSQDAAGVAALYAEDARAVTGDGTIKDGRAEIEALFRSFMDSGFHDHEIGMLSAERTGDVIYETGTWKGVGGDGKTYGGHLVNIYERQGDGSWKTVLHFWN